MKKLTYLFLACLAPVFLMAQNNAPVDISGVISLGGYIYHASGIPDRQAPYGYSINAHSTLHLKGIDIPFSVILNEQGRTFQQPFSRFGLSPTWKWGKLHLGHRNLNFSPFILAGQTMFMAGVELTPGKWRIAALRGRMNDAVGSDNPNFLTPRFQRNSLVLKLGGGTDKTHFDFIFLKGKDDLNSLPNEPDSVRDNTLAQENSVFGIQWRQPMFKSKLLFKLDAAASTFINDIRYSRIDFSEELPSVHRIRFIIRPNPATHITYAGESSLKWQHKNFSLSSVYRRVAPEYRSMGVNYLLTDVEALTLRPSLVMAKGKAVIGASIGRERNNLDNRRVENTERTIGSLDLNFNPSSAFGVAGQYSNYTVQQQVFKDNLSNDSILINQINHNVMVSPRFTIFKPSSTQTFLLTLNYQVLDDKNQSTGQFNDNNLVNAFLNYVINEPAAGVNYRVGFNYFKFESNLFLNIRWGGAAGIRKRFGETGFSLSGHAAISLIKQETLGEASNGMNYSFNGTAEYSFSKKNSISFQLFYLRNDIGDKNFSETRGQLRYNYRF
ncbi:MAG: hypothetical protein AAFZ15_18025 [Bacteroidota bacterium]